MKKKKDSKIKVFYSYKPDKTSELRVQKALGMLIDKKDVIKYFENQNLEINKTIKK